MTKTMKRLNANSLIYHTVKTTGITRRSLFSPNVFRKVGLNERLLLPCIKKTYLYFSLFVCLFVCFFPIIVIVYVYKESILAMSSDEISFLCTVCSYYKLPNQFVYIPNCADTASPLVA